MARSHRTRSDVRRHPVRHEDPSTRRCTSPNNEAAARELAEETEIRAEAADLVRPIFQAVHPYSYAGVDYLD